MLSAAAAVIVQAVSPRVTIFSQATLLNPDPEMVSSASAKPIMLLAFPGAAELLTLMEEISEVRQEAKVKSRSAASVAQEESAKLQSAGAAGEAGELPGITSAEMEPYVAVIETTSSAS